MELKVSVVLPAAGSGERMNTTVPKQFQVVRGKAIIVHTIEAFSRIAWVEHIVVPTSECRMDELRGLCADQTKVHVTQGASVRHRSIWNGVKAVKHLQPDCDVVVIHDGVRPLIEAQLLETIVKEASIYGAAGVVRPLVSTIVSTDGDGLLEESLDRNKYRASEMPQAFLYTHIAAAYQSCTDYDLDYGTECLHIAKKYAGSKVKLIEGPDYLWKVTFKKDVYALESVLKDKARYVASLVNFTDTQLKEYVRQYINSRIQICDDVNDQTDTIICCDCKEERPSELAARVTSQVAHSTCTLVVCVGRDMDRLCDIVNSLKDTSILVYGIMCNVGGEQKLLELINHLVMERSKLMSGQIFVAE